MMYGGVEVCALATLSTEERAHGTPRMGGWMGPRVGMDYMENLKIYCIHQELNPSSLASGLWAIAALVDVRKLRNVCHLLLLSRCPRK